MSKSKSGMAGTTIALLVIVFSCIGGVAYGQMMCVGKQIAGLDSSKSASLVVALALLCSGAKAK